MNRRTVGEFERSKFGRWVERERRKKNRQVGRPGRKQRLDHAIRLILRTPKGKSESIFSTPLIIMSSRKREKPYYSRHVPYSQPKRRRPLPLDAAPADDADTYVNSAAAKAPTSVVVIGVPAECSVLDLKSRFEMYGPISRTRMEPDGVAYINFRGNEAAQSAVDAARDSSFPITLNSDPVQVMWASDPVPQWRAGVGRKEGLSSKLVRAELPLRRHGRGNKLSSAIVNPRKANDGNNGDSNNDEGLIKATAAAIGGSGMKGPFRGREIVAYDDIL